VDRLTVAEAAERLGISKDAVRQRIRRHTIEYERDEDGNVYVLLSPEPTQHDAVQDDEPHAVQAPVLLDYIETLKAQLAAEREANRENRRLLAAALERIPELEAPRGSRGFDQTGEEQSGRDRTREDEPARQNRFSGEQPFTEEEEPERRPSWWRRFFLGP
jgi:excisionase family DNA binding protein